MRVKKTVQEIYLNEEVCIVVTTTEYDMLPSQANSAMLLDDDSPFIDDEDLIDDDEWQEEDEEDFEENMEDEE